jgi:hypothetical protein
MNAYEQAAARIAATPELEPYRDAILLDWPEGDAHFTWAATCDLAELLSWAESVTADAVVAAPGVPLLKGPALDHMMAKANAEAERLSHEDEEDAP